MGKLGQKMGYDRY